MNPQHQTAEPVIFRQVAFPLSSFDYLKDYQRRYEEQHGARLTNNQTLALILKEHQQQNPINEARGVRNEQTDSTARA